MTVHELRILQPFFDHVKDGKKKFEIRKNDRNFSVNDSLVLKETFDLNGEETGRKAYFDITYILHKGPGLAKGYVILGISPRGLLI